MLRPVIPKIHGQDGSSLNKLSLQSPFITRAATLIAAVLLGLSGARAANLWMQTNNSPPQGKIGAVSQHKTKSTNKKVDYRRLAKLHLLGEIENKAKQTPIKQEITKAPETNLNLKLIGVLFDRESQDGYAIISESGKPQKTFHKGDKVSSNATLYAVEPNRVILMRNGRHEALTLIKPNLHVKAPSSNSHTKVPTSTKTSLVRSQSTPNQPILIEPLETSPVAVRPTQLQ